MPNHRFSRLIAGFAPSLAYRDFRFLWGSSLSAGAAAWGLIVARGWLVYQESGSSVWVGITTFAAMIPLFLVPPIAGFLADKMDRRRLLSWVYLIQLAHNLLLALLALTGVIEIWHVVILSFINGLARASQMPATQALLPNVVPKEHMLNAVALNAATFHGSRLVGAGLVVPMVALNGSGGAFLLCTALYAVAFLSNMRIGTASKGKIDQTKGTLQNFLAGVQYVYAHPTILPLVIVVFLHCCLTMSFESLLPVLVDTRLGGSEGGFGLLMMAVGAGSLFGVLVLTPITRPLIRGRMLLTLGFISGLAPLGLGTASSMLPAMISAALMGASQAGFMALSAAIIQSATPDGIRGRVMSVYLWHIGGVMALFNLLGGYLADIVGAPLLITVPGLVFAGLIPMSLLRRSLRDLYARGDIPGRSA